MVKAGWVRIEKYKHKIHPDVLRQRFDALKGIMVEQENVKLSALTSLEESVKPILEANGVRTLQIPFYLSYARAIWKKAEKFTGSTLDLEVQFVYETWKARGLDPTILQEIASVVGVTILQP